MSRTKWSGFSIIQCALKIFAIGSGGCRAAGQVGDDVDRLPAPFTGSGVDAMPDGPGDFIAVPVADAFAGD
ncbi:hypothetical protein [Streptomyces ipomoeae]|uniref:Uncharacterized protein n=1 Tax=Streptomyces ipomoeae 91-03 TaxID=698759 RepID=L1L438_9ACTN|nr:hypothetical protein [Streptomyces ipomoeae]EKX67796.1 hypothetical protein STRIP9103_05563 [Streptomyces ipomoeae 91-03]MDX2692319.1 hypothetical protein [Streptomyces ipomoeae]MDX2837851.1 hypothetical protein [Streptomyces ipomoeae]